MKMISAKRVTAPVLSHTKGQLSRGIGREISRFFENWALKTAPILLGGVGHGV